ncbi:Squalene synthase HpnC [Azospirillaceae bacterium]
MTEILIAPTSALHLRRPPRRVAGLDVFPVGSPLIPRPIRPHVFALNRFITWANAIADAPNLSPEVRVASLDDLERALDYGGSRQRHLRPARDLHHSLRATGLSARCVRHALIALRREAADHNFQSWDELETHCRAVAAPLGRYLLELLDESDSANAHACDALCTSLRLLRRLQNGRHDWMILGRSPLPLDWFKEEKISVERLIENRCDPALRHLFNRALARLDLLLEQASPLPDTLRHAGLRLETAVTLGLATTLSHRLRRLDPMVTPVILPPHHRLLAVARGFARGLTPPHSGAP